MKTKVVLSVFAFFAIVIFSTSCKKDNTTQIVPVISYDTVNQLHQIHIPVDANGVAKVKILHNNSTSIAYKDSICPKNKIDIFYGSFSVLCRVEIDSTTWKVIPYKMIIITPDIPEGMVAEITFQ